MGQVVPVSVRVSSEISPLNRSTTPNDAGGLAPGVGQDLSRARQHRGKTLEDVSGDLKILPNYLTAIETGRFENLPAPDACAHRLVPKTLAVTQADTPSQIERSRGRREIGGAAPKS